MWRGPYRGCFSGKPSEFFNILLTGSNAVYAVWVGRDQERVQLATTAWGFFLTRKGLYAWLSDMDLFLALITPKAIPKNTNPTIMDEADGFSENAGPNWLPINAPAISMRIGKTYSRNVKNITGAVSRPMTTWSPSATLRVFLTETTISFWLLAVPQLFLDEQDSHAPDRTVFTHAVAGVADVTIPFSVIMGECFLQVRQQC